jgi:hypothetical protein
MLEHYGRFQQSDFDQIAEACLQVKQKKVERIVPPPPKEVYRSPAQFGLFIEAGTAEKPMIPEFKIDQLVAG